MLINLIKLTLNKPHLGDWLMGYGQFPVSPVYLSTCEQMARRVADMGRVPLPVVDLASPMPSPASPVTVSSDPEVDGYAEDAQDEDVTGDDGPVSATCWLKILKYMCDV